MKKVCLIAASIGIASLFLPTTSSRADVCNLKVVTDANPDYSDIGSLIYSATSNWQATSNKVWAMFYWNSIARRASTPMVLHGLEVTDPIQQFNDYGYAMCSTVSGINCAIFGAMGLPIKFWDIAVHTVMEVEYDGKYHMIDDDFTGIYTLCDGHTLAGVDEIGQEGACAASNWKVEPGHIAKYHCLTATSPNGELTGGDGKTLPYMAGRFAPTALKFRDYLNHWNLGHRYSLNLRENEVYTRYYHRLDADSPNAIPQPKNSKTYRSDPAYFVPDPIGCKLFDLDTDPGVGFNIRGNGIRTYAPDLSALALPKSAWSIAGVKANPAGVVPAAAGQAGSVIFRVEGANVITSLKIHAEITRRTATDKTEIAISTDNGLNWKEVYAADQTGKRPVDLKLIPEVNGTYAVLVKVSLLGQAAATDVALQSIQFETITEINRLTQPKLRLGKNTVYVGTGEQTETIVVSPDLTPDHFKDEMVEGNVTNASPEAYAGMVFAPIPNVEGYMVYKIDAPTDITRFTYGGRLYNRGQKCHIDFRHSFDNGKTWIQAYSLTDTTSPWDVIHYETVTNAPAGTRRVLFKYTLTGGNARSCSIYAVRMEAHSTPVEVKFKPLEVTYTWKEVQKDYTTVERSHVQRVDQVPFTYTINVGGADHPVMESLRVNLMPLNNNGSVKYGYSDGKDIGGVKLQDRWFADGKILSVGKPYTTTEKSLTAWGAGDPDGKKLTDGVVGGTIAGGIQPTYGVLYDTKMKPEITVDLGETQKCGAFRIHVSGYPWWDSLKGEIKDQVELLTSVDGKEFISRGFFNFNLRFKDVPVNFFLPDSDAMSGYNAPLILDQPVEARYVKYRLTPARGLAISEVQVLDRITYTPFDLKIALPDGKDRSDIAAYPPRHEPSSIFKRVLKLMGPDGGKLIGPTGN